MCRNSASEWARRLLLPSEWASERSVFLGRILQVPRATGRFDLAAFFLLLSASFLCRQQATHASLRRRCWCMTMRAWSEMWATHFKKGWALPWVAPLGGGFSLLGWGERARSFPFCRSKAFRAYASSLLRAESASNSHLSLLFVSTRAHSTTELSRPVTFLLSSLSAHRVRAFRSSRCFNSKTMLLCWLCTTLCYGKSWICFMMYVCHTHALFEFMHKFLIYVFLAGICNNMLGLF